MSFLTQFVAGFKAARAPRAQPVSLFPEGGIGRTLLSSLWPGRYGEPPEMGVAQQLNAYTTMPWLRAVAEKVAQSVAACEWQLFVTTTPNGKAIREKAIQRATLKVRRKALRDRREADRLREIEDHLFFDALDRPNGFHTGLQLRKITQTHIDLVGEAFWFKERNAVGAPVRFWPLPPHWVLATPTPDRPVYRLSWRGFQADVPDTEILWLNNPNPAQPYGRGTGIGQALGAELETDDYAAKLTRQMFFNQARPDFLVWPKGEAGGPRDAEIMRMEQDWLTRHQGFQRAARPHFLPNEVGVYEFEKNLRDLQFIELRQHERDTIIQVFGGVPPEWMGILQNSNRATIESAAFLVDKYVVVPRLELQRSIFQERLIPEYDERLILDYVSPVSEDLAEQNNVVRTHAWAFTVDEIRERGGEPPLDNPEDGACHAVWMNMTFQRDLLAPEPVASPIVPTDTPTPQEVGLPAPEDAGDMGQHDPSAQQPETPSRPDPSPED